MPLDNNFGDQLFYARCLGWERKFTWIPRRCDLTGSIIWLEWAYRGTACHQCDVTFFYEYRWRDADQHLIWVLKQ